MTLHVPTLNIVSIAMLGMSAALMTLFGTTGRVYRGFWWWAAAQWLLTLGLVATVWQADLPWLAPVAQLLILQWPMAVMAGMRRFYARHEWSVPDAGDGVLLAFAWGAWFAGWLLNLSQPVQTALLAAGTFVLHMYVAVLLRRLPAFQESMALKALAAMEVAAATVQTLRVVQAWGEHSGVSHGGDQMLLAASLLLVATSLAMVYLCILLSSERTESNLRNTQRKLRFLADMDTLTHVPNRRHFHELAEHTLAVIDPERAAVLMFDIDHFKRINDMLGHAVGDEALRQVAHCTRETLREMDVAGRLGGDEFAVLLPDTPVTDAMSVAARIVTRLEYRQVAPRVAPLSLSFGVVQMRLNESIGDALRRADQALYEAKRQGRSRAVVATGAESQPVFSQSRTLGLSTA